MRSTKSKAALLAAGTTMLVAVGVQAQTPPVAAESDELVEVTVTGSRVIANGNDAPTPIAVITPSEVLATRPTTIFENLADLPMFSGSRGVTNTPTNAQPTAATSISALNLRNLGGLRALALFDGHRVPPTTADGYVNVNSLPQMLLTRVDVVTGGASAVYGSDAVTGVVNFVVDRDFSGVRVDLQAGMSGESDSESYQVGIAAGMDLFDGRAHIEGSWQRLDDRGIPHRGDRDWTSPLWTLQGNGSAATPFHLQDDVHIITTTWGGMVVCPLPTAATGNQASCPTRPRVGYQFDNSGVLAPFQVGLRGPANGLADATVQIGGDGAYHTWPSLKSDVTMDQAFARFDFDLTDNLNVYVQGAGARDNTSGNPTNLRFFQPTNIGACNPLLSVTDQQALGCTDPPAQANSPTPPTFAMTKMFNFLDNPDAPGANMQTIAQSYFLIAGIEGAFGEGYRWEAAYSNSESELNTRVNRNQNLRNTYAAIDAVVNPANGQIVCRVDLTNPGVYPGCVPINLFGPGAGSREAFDYIFQRIEHTTTHKMDSLTASLAGAPLNTWAGPLDMAISGEYRRQTYELTSTSPPSLVQDCVGLRFGNCTAGRTPVNINVIAPRSEVEQKVAEGAFEFNAPLLADKAFARALNLNAAVRYTRYDNEPNDPLLTSSSFDATTWKVGLVWSLTDDWTIRAARSRDIRAPNLFDLYSPVAINPNTFTTDYLLAGNPQGNVPQQTGGNPNLTPEVGNTTTVGLVFRPTSNFSMALDYYDISIEDALASLNGMAQGIQQACYSSGGSSPLCGLQERALGNVTDTSPANRLIKTYSRQVNIAEQRTWGIDFETNYTTLLAGQQLSLRFLLNYQPELVFSQPGLPTVDHAGAAYNQAYGLLPAPVWKAILFARYDITERLAVDASLRYRSGLEWTNDKNLFVSDDVSSVTYTNVSASYGFNAMGADLNLFFNIQNLFDKDPPPSGTVGLQNQPGLPSNGYIVGDDVVGRYFTLGVRMKF
jgi:iron complex outermembrane recepter protein